MTTAATHWAVTVIDLCFHGGQLILGLCCTAIGLLALWGFKFPEQHIRQGHRATLTVDMATDATVGREISCCHGQHGYAIAEQGACYVPEGGRIDYDLKWGSARLDMGFPEFLAELANRSGSEALRWIPHGSAKP